MQHYSDELKAKILTELKEKQSVTTLSKQYIISSNTIRNIHFSNQRITNNFCQCQLRKIFSIFFYKATIL